MKEKNKVTIKIPRPLYNNLKKIIKDTGFRSVNEFIIHCLRDIASGGKLRTKKDTFTKKEIILLRERLRKLGYIK